MSSIFENQHLNLTTIGCQEREFSLKSGTSPSNARLTQNYIKIRKPSTSEPIVPTETELPEQQVPLVTSGDAHFSSSVKSLVSQ
jgi:hypothetical protein